MFCSYITSVVYLLQPYYYSVCLNSPAYQIDTLDMLCFVTFELSQTLHYYTCIYMSVYVQVTGWVRLWVT